MKTSILLLAFFLYLLPAACLRAETVTLTDTQGRSIEVKIVTVTAGIATVTLANGRQHRIPESSLNEQSKKVLIDWRLSQLANQPRAPFNISVRNFTENKETSSSASTRTITYDEGYTVTVENDTPIKIPALKVKYVMFKNEAVLRAKSSKEIIKSEASGNAELEPMGLRGKSEFQTQTIPMRDTRLKSGYYFLGGGSENAIDKLAGICIRIYSGDKIIYEYARPSYLLGKVDWN